MYQSCVCVQCILCTHWYVHISIPYTMMFEMYQVVVDIHQTVRMMLVDANLPGYLIDNIYIPLS